MDSERHAWAARFAWAFGFTALVVGGALIGPAAAISALVAVAVLSVTAVRTKGRGLLGGLVITAAAVALLLGTVALLADDRRPSWTLVIALLALVLAVLAVVVAFRRRPRMTP
jgi:hypothetical protein